MSESKNCFVASQLGKICTLHVGREVVREKTSLSLSLSLSFSLSLFLSFSLSLSLSLIPSPCIYIAHIAYYILHHIAYSYIYIQVNIREMVHFTHISNLSIYRLSEELQALAPKHVVKGLHQQHYMATRSS